MSTEPLVSVLVPSYNAERYLPESVPSVLAQTWKRLEVIVIDDGSVDSTAAVAAELARTDDRVRVVRREHRGVSAARNAGFAELRGELLCLLDADDIFLPDKLERQVAFLKLFPSVDLVFSDLYFSDGDLTPSLYVCRRPPVDPLEDVLLYRNWLPMMVPLLRTSLLRRVGGFDETLTHAEDWDFWFRASRCGRMAYLPGPVGVCRRHGTQASNDWDRTRDGSLRVVAKHRTPGSREWRAGRAALSWVDAKHAWGARDYLGTVRHLARCVLHARSRRTLLDLHAVMSA